LYKFLSRASIYTNYNMRTSLSLAFVVLAAGETVFTDKPFIEAQLAAKKLEQEVKLMQKHSDKASPKIEAWYINMEGHKDRAECMELQLRAQGFQPHREEGVKWPSNKAALSSNLARIKSSGLGDCVSNGINLTSTKDHAGKDLDEDTLRANILSNYCGHKRLIEKLAARNTTADYFLVFEDDAQLKPWFRLMLEDFVQNYDGPWSAVQIDPFFVKSSIAQVKPGLEKTYRNKTIYHGGIVSGIQTMLVKKSHIQDVVSALKQNQAMPADHIGRYVDSMIAWKPYISTHPGWWGEQVDQKCAESVSKSRIGGHGTKKQTAKFLAKELGFPMKVEDEQIDIHIGVHPAEEGPMSVPRMD